MHRFILLVAVSLILPAQAVAMGEGRVDDQGHLFSPGAVAAAEKSISAIQEKTGWEILVKTIDSVSGDDKQKAMEATAQPALSRDGAQRLLIVISKADGRVLIRTSPEATKTFDKARLDQIHAWITTALQGKSPDSALIGALSMARFQAMDAPATPPIVGMRDEVGMFPPDAVSRADEILKRVYSDNHWRVFIETVDSLEGRPIKEVAAGRMKAADAHGLFVLVSRADRRTCILVQNDEVKLYPKEKIEELQATLDDNLQVHQYTKGLLALVNKIEAVTTPHAVALHESALSLSPVRRLEVPRIRRDPNSPLPAYRESPAGSADRGNPAPALGPARGPIFLGIGLGVLTLLWFVLQAWKGQSPTAPTTPPADEMTG